MRRVLWILAALAATVASEAHPIHASYAEAEFRPETGRLEIALRLFSDDAETALSAQAGKKVRLESTAAAELDRLLLALVRAAFVVKSKSGAAQPLAWVGRELKDGDQHLWVYVTCPLPGGVAGAVFADRVLRDTFSDQLNSVRVRDHSVAPARQLTLLFANESEQTVRFEK